MSKSEFINKLSGIKETIINVKSIIFQIFLKKEITLFLANHLAIISTIKRMMHASWVNEINSDWYDCSMPMSIQLTRMINATAILKAWEATIFLKKIFIYSDTLLPQFEQYFDSGGSWLPHSQTFGKTNSQALQMVVLLPKSVLQFGHGL